MCACRPEPAACRLATLRDFAFPPAVRLRTAAEFSPVFRHGRRVADQCFVLLARPNQGVTARLGLAVARKAVRRAVQRNRMKRLIRNSFRERRQQLAALDIVVLVKADAPAFSNQALYDRLARLWQELPRHA